MFFIEPSSGGGGGGGGGGGFDGPKQCTLTFVDASNHAVSSVVFTVVGTGTAATDGTGTITIGLNPGTYTITANPTSGTMWASQTITVTNSASQSFTITGTANTITPPSDPTLCTVQFKVFDQDLNPAAGRAIYFALTKPATGSGEAWIVSEEQPLSAIAASDGTVTVQLPQSSSWAAFASVGARKATFDVPASTTYNPPNMRI